VTAANPLRQTAFGMASKKAVPTPDELKAAYDAFCKGNPHIVDLTSISKGLKKDYPAATLNYIKKQLEEHHEPPRVPTVKKPNSPKKPNPINTIESERRPLGREAAARFTSTETLY
jgi:hypothetical protein